MFLTILIQVHCLSNICQLFLYLLLDCQLFLLDKSPALSEILQFLPLHAHNVAVPLIKVLTLSELLLFLVHFDKSIEFVKACKFFR